MAENVASPVKTTSNSVSYPDYWPQTYPTPTFYNAYLAPEQTYANKVEVIRGEHDVTLRFFRQTGSSSRIKEVTIPAGLFDWLKEQA